MGNEWEDVEKELNSGSGDFFSPGKLVVDTPVEVVIERHTKWADTKYPIKDKNGNSLGYTWRFFLRDGRVWDVSNRNRRVILNGLHPKGEETVVPGRFRVTNVGKVVNKEPQTKVEFLGAAGEAEDDSTAF